MLAVAVLGVAGAAFGGLWTGSAASAADPTPNAQIKIVAASIGGHSLFGTSTDRPVPMEARGDIPLSITIRNTGVTPVAVRYFRITGAMLGIRFVRFEASTRLVVPGGETRTITQPADFFDLDQSATGYINTAIQVVDPQRVTLASHSFVASVKGKFLSSEGILLLELIVVLADWSRADPVRRHAALVAHEPLHRGVLFGLTTGSAALAIVVGIAMLKIGLVAPTTWIPAALLATAGGFALGYISPGPLDRRAHEAAEETVIDLVAAEAVAHASGQHERRTTGEVVSHSSGEHTPGTESDGRNTNPAASRPARVRRICAPARLRSGRPGELAALFVPQEREDEVFSLDSLERDGSRLTEHQIAACRSDLAHQRGNEDFSAARMPGDRAATMT